MDQPTSKPKTRNNSFHFYGCFGFSGKMAKKKKFKANSGDRKKVKWWFSWSGLRSKKLELSEKVNRSKQVHDDDKLAWKVPLPVTGEMPTPPERLALNLQDKPLKKRHKSAQGRIVERSKSLDGRSSSKTETDQVLLSFDRKKDAKKDKITIAEPLEVRSKPSDQNNTGLSNASSFTLQRRKKVSIEGEKYRANKRKQKPPEDEKLKGESEFIYGLSIIMVTLIIMLIWGKLCAIICTSAWLYLIQLLKKVRESDASVNSVENRSRLIYSNMINEAHKKKVVLDGFLERNHTNALRTLYSTNKNVDISD